MRRFPLLSIWIASAACIAAFADQPSSPASGSAEPKHLAVAKELVAHLDLSNTDYAHGVPKVSFASPYESHADCSGFADALLTFSYDLDKKSLRKIFGSGRPTAARYYDAVENQSGFTQIKHVQDALPGDFLAIKYLTRKDNTGHVMLVAARPEQLAQGTKPVKPGTSQWRVTVIDSSESGHGPSDTRHAHGANGKDHDGLGEGVFRVYADAAGDPVGFAWSTVGASKFKAPEEEELLIGRFKVNNATSP
jgi:hypothetical protein